VSVYVDDARNQFGRMLMCHMIADSSKELLRMAKKIALPAKWIQYRGTYKEHFDVCRAKRDAAIHHGAIPITRRELAAKITARRGKHEGSVEHGEGALGRLAQEQDHAPQSAGHVREGDAESRQRTLQFVASGTKATRPA
jgi:hypothetical protein